MFAANVLDPNGLGNPYHPWSKLCALVAFVFLITGLGIAQGGSSARVMAFRCWLRERLWSMESLIPYTKMNRAAIAATAATRKSGTTRNVGIGPAVAPGSARSASRSLRALG
jgi:hypothetical protein